MPFNLEDAVRELQREVRELRSQLGRLPTRPAIFEGGSGGNRILGTATAAVATTDPTFLIDNIFLVRGTDPRVDPLDAAETLEVKNTLHLELDPSHPVHAEQNEDGEWETWADTKADIDGEVYTAGCGILIVSNVVSVNAASLAGPGLEYEGCALGVNVGCGLKIESDAVLVEPLDLAGPGLWVEEGTEGDCDVLAIVYNCSLDIPDSGPDEGLLKVNEDFPACGLKWTDDEEQCSITLDLEELTEGAEESFLEPQGNGTDECAIKVKWEEFEAHQITSFGIEGDELILKFNKVKIKVLEIGTIIPEEMGVVVTEVCPEDIA